MARSIRHYALIDHLRSIDKRRVKRMVGNLAPEELAAVDEGLAAFLGLAHRYGALGIPPVQ